MKIMGLDMSTKSTGVAIFEDKELIYYTCLTASSTNLMKRIEKIVDGIEDILNKYPDIEKIIMEEVIPTTGKNVKTWKALMYLQAIVMMMLYKKFPKIKTELIYPNSWRSRIGIHTGKGETREKLKAHDIHYVETHYGIKVNDDIADAICIAYSSFVPSFFR